MNKKLIRWLAPSLFIGVFSTSCMKEPELNQNFGPEVSKNAIDNALSNAESVDPKTTFKLNEFVSNDISVRIESLPSHVIQQNSTTLSQKIDCLFATNNKPTDCKVYNDNGYEGFIISLAYELVEIGNNGQANKSKSGESGFLLLGKKPATSPAAFSNLNIFESNPSAQVDAKSVYNSFSKDLTWRKVLAQATSPSGRPYTYHNFSTTKLQMTTPLEVQKDPNCGGLLNAQVTSCPTTLQVTEIRFDKVDWTDTQPVKTSAIFWIGKDVPFLAKQMLGCISTTQPYGEARIAVSQCTEVKYFTFGKD